MLYKKSSEISLSDELFRNPTSEYRGAPFWAWNSKLEKDELLSQIEIFRQMGLGGFHIHVRTGMKTEYLGDEFMSHVKTCVKKAKEENMLAYLYDEDRWPSGAAGGLVTRDEKYRARCLIFTPFRYVEKLKINTERNEGGRTNKGELLATYDVVLDEEGYLKSYRRIEENDNAEGTKWYALLEIHQPSKWYNNCTYADTLNEEAVRQFTRVTHEKYKAEVGEEFDKVIPSIFTDEPQFTRKGTLNNSHDLQDLMMPWTDSVPEKYFQTYGEDIYATIPELFWELPDGKISVHRYRYHDFIAELFAHSFADTVGGWCENNGIALTGHVLEEQNLESQCRVLGEAMRSYRSFTIPGIDMLCFRYEYNTAKQAQSAVHQYGREGMMCEIYGVTNWDCDFRTYKIHGDWQAALGVTLRVPHLSWYSMGGEAKRDYPASINHFSPWYKKYGLIENHYSRVNAAMTRGKPVVRVGVIHPVESMWLRWGVNDKTAFERNELNKNFEDVTNWLLEGCIDFDFISESLLPSLCEKGSAPLKVGAMSYDAVVVAGCETLRKTTVERLNAFADNGGKLIFMGKAPGYLDGEKSDIPKELYNKSQAVPFCRGELIKALEDVREVKITTTGGNPVYNYIYQLRKDNDCKWLFVAHKKEPYNIEVDPGQDIVVSVNGDYIVTLYDTQSGEIVPLKAEYKNGKTAVKRRLYGYDSLLLKLEEGRSTEGEQPAAQNIPEGEYISSVVDYSLSEPNVLLLDIARYKLNNEEYNAPEEILRLDNICRRKHGMTERGGAIVQPYIKSEVSHFSKLWLKFEFDSEIETDGCSLALEELENVTEIVFNGGSVDLTSTGYYVDKPIKTVALPVIHKGENILEVCYNYNEKVNIESMFILGNFGVKLIGTEKTITELPKKIGFGDLNSQGLPFYGGNVTYKFSTNVENNSLSLCIPFYKGTLIEIKVDGETKGHIIYPPYLLKIDNLENGEHEIEVILYLHRYNAFGPVHLPNKLFRWHGPSAWRKDGANFSYEYNLKQTGIFVAPRKLG